jgi:hypothetical protein
MGKRDRERIERIERGEEQPISTQRGLNNPIARTAVKLASRGKVIETLSAASTEEQIEVLGSISPTKVGKAIMRKAPKEMDAGIAKFRKLGKKITVDALLEEVRTTPGFLVMCESAGVPYSWFEELAQERMKVRGEGD